MENMILFLTDKNTISLFSDDWLPNLISSIWENVTYDYWISNLKDLVKLDNGKKIADATFLVTGFNYIIRPIFEINWDFDSFSSIFMESHARLFGNNFYAYYFDLLVHLFQEYYTIPTRQMQLRESFGNLIWYFIYHL
jgi:hypothetical protein